MPETPSDKPHTFSSCLDTLSSCALRVRPALQEQDQNITGTSKLHFTGKGFVTRDSNWPRRSVLGLLLFHHYLEPKLHFCQSTDPSSLDPHPRWSYRWWLSLFDCYSYFLVSLADHLSKNLHSLCRGPQSPDCWLLQIRCYQYDLQFKAVYPLIALAPSQMPVSLIHSSLSSLIFQININETKWKIEFIRHRSS